MSIQVLIESGAGGASMPVPATGRFEATTMDGRGSAINQGLEGGEAPAPFRFANQERIEDDAQSTTGNNTSDHFSVSSKG